MFKNKKLVVMFLCITLLTGSVSASKVFNRENQNLNTHDSIQDISKTMTNALKGDNNQITITPKDSIQEAINNCPDNGKIILTKGVYNQSDIVINKDITIEGNSNVIIDAEGKNRIFGVYGCNVNINKLTLKNGRVSKGNGGAIYVNSYDDYSSVNLKDSIFINNTATNYGGAIYGDSTVSDSTFINNTAGDSGGAIHSFDSIDVSCSTFINNKAIVDGGAIYGSSKVKVSGSNFTNNNVGYNGGAIRGDYAVIDFTTFTNNEAKTGGAIDGSQPTVGSSTFINNKAFDDGGAIGGYSTNIKESTFTDNNAINGNGGAIRSSGTVRYSTFTNNNASSDGGAIYGVSTVSDSTFTNNKASSNGGAINGNYGSTVRYSTFTNNKAYDGGAFYSDYSCNEITESCFTNNTATNIGGAVYVTNGSYYNSTLTGSVFNGNGGGSKAFFGSIFFKDCSGSDI
ncbi:MAG: hypothetical protein LBB45_00140 [Methanobrevibacter sp.]|jgi:predicted outer membrane repeat protein|nr:hypothetical protein [Candidatus Methanovirga basalitermitum]